MHSLADIIIGATANTMNGILTVIALLPWPDFPNFIGTAIGAVAGLIGTVLNVLGASTKSAILSALTWLAALQLIIIPLIKAKTWFVSLSGLLIRVLRG